MKTIKPIKLSKDKDNYEVFNITIDDGQVINDIELDKFLRYIDGFIDTVINQIINKYGISKNEKEDLKQETYIKLLAFLPKIDVDKNFKGYIAQSMRNFMKNVIRNKKKKDRFGMMCLYDSEIINDMDITPDGNPNILDIIIYQEKEDNKGGKR